MEALKYTYWDKRGGEIKVYACETYDGEFALSWNTPNGYPRRSTYATAEKLIKAFNRKTNNQTK